LGVVLGEDLTYAFDDPGAVAFLGGIAEVCSKRGYGLLIVPTRAGEDDPDRVVAAAVDAYVVWTTTADDPVLTAACSTRRPVVVHGGPDLDGTTLISIDNRAAARAVGAEVFATARRPAVLSFPVDRNRDSFVRPGLDPEAVAYPVTRDRLAGYRDAAEDLGIDWSRVPVGVCRTNAVDEARAVTRRLLASAPDLDAVAAMGDKLALGALREAPGRLRISGRRAGARPDDGRPVAARARGGLRGRGARRSGTGPPRRLAGGPACLHRQSSRPAMRSSTGRAAPSRKAAS
jgi:DNA-binding LacI/PurR family transcriptional regulator